MQAVVYTEYGSPDVLQLKEVDKPAHKDNEVLVKVDAASINSWDWDMLTGKPLEYRFLSGLLKPKKTNILGCDIAGRVEAIGKNITHFQVGDAVFGDLSEGKWGGFAEYACASENELNLKPANMTFAQAAATPQAGLLAIQALMKKGEITPGQQILINGAGGGVGTFAIQIAKYYGAEVTGVDKAEKLQTIKALGADHVIDYTRQDFTAAGKQYDLILDVKTDRSVFKYSRALKPNGLYITVGGSSLRMLQLALVGAFISRISDKRLSILVFKPNNDMPRLYKLMESGKLKPLINRVFPLSETANAFRYFGTGKFKGKVVITVNQSDHSEST